MKNWMLPSLLMVSLGFLVSGASPLWAGPKSVLGGKVPVGQRVSIDAVDHSAWDALLQKYVDDRGDVNYAAWQQSATDVQRLDQYLRSLSRGERSRSASLASLMIFPFLVWINAYNAVTIRGILREYPTTSIRNHTAILYGYNIWKDLLLQVGDIQISLEDIEHKLLRKMGEPRIHFAIVCASKGCPRLANRAYTAAQLDRQLTQNTTDFFANARHFRYDASRQRMYLSTILDWFAEDFGRTSAEQLRWLASYLPDETSARAARSGNVRVSYLEYDWSLNDQARQARRP